MSDTDETKRPAKTLSLKKTETSTVKQSFSHGRTKAVVVEKKRSATPPAAAKAAKPAEKSAEKAATPAAAPANPRENAPGRARPPARSPRRRQDGRACARRGAAPAFGRGKGAPRRRPGRCAGFRQRSTPHRRTGSRAQVPRGRAAQD